MRETFNVGGDGSLVKLDALWAKALASFIKMKTRKGQASMVSRRD